jgi:hypothetical protein
MKATDAGLKVMTYPQLQNYNHIDDVFGSKEGIALLFMTNPDYGHWTLLTKQNGGIEFFDSYGNFPSDLIKKINKNSTIAGQEYPKLTELLLRSRYRLSVNTKKLQRKGETIASCGRYVILRYNNRNMKLNDFIGMLKTIKGGTDKAVTLLTNGV